jgi:Tfp pilus assembly protein PilV
MHISQEAKHTLVYYRGVTLIELLVFMVVTALIVVGLGRTFQYAMETSSQPLINNQLLLAAESMIDVINSRKYDENSAVNAAPCDIAIACVGRGLDSGENINDLQTLDDVDDFDGYSTVSAKGIALQVSVTYTGSALGIRQEHAKHILVRAQTASGKTLNLSVYRINE